MPTKFPILGNRTIDKLKVLELKEELKKRGLSTSGLKEDLLKRLSEVICPNNGEDCDFNSNSGSKRVADSAETTAAIDNANNILEDGDLTIGTVSRVDEVVTPPGTSENLLPGQTKESEGGAKCFLGNFAISGSVHTSCVADHLEKDSTLSEIEFCPTEIQTCEKLMARSLSTTMESETPGLFLGNEKSNLLVEAEGIKPQTKNDDLRQMVEDQEILPHSEIEDLRSQPNAVDLSPPCEVSTPVSYVEGVLNTPMEADDLKTHLECKVPECTKTDDSGNTFGGLSAAENVQVYDEYVNHDKDIPKRSPDDILRKSHLPYDQVSEVNPILEVKIKSDSIFTDSVSFNEKKELKANIIADNVKIELGAFSQGIAPGSYNSDIDSDVNRRPGGGGNLHKESRIVEDNSENPHESRFSFDVEGIGSPKTDVVSKNEFPEVAYSEKLNIDRSSGDDSVEEDALDTKKTDLAFVSIGDEDVAAQTNSAAMLEESFVDVVGDDSPFGEEIISDDKQISTSRFKRKFTDKGVEDDTELPKRLRRSNTEKLKDPQAETSLVDFAPILKRNLSCPDPSINTHSHEERIVAPSLKSPTNSLRIDRFVRPFTLKAVQELLGKTGNIVNFWMDHIKTHCYVTYSSVQEAVDTRNAVYNLQWPLNGGRLLVAEYAEEQEVKTRTEMASSLLPTPVTSHPPLAPLPLPPPLPFHHSNPLYWNQVSPSYQAQSILPPPPPLPQQPQEMEWLPPPPPLPFLSSSGPPPMVTLDDLFRKTATQPRIYYMPLSDEEVAAKQGGRQPHHHQDDSAEMVCRSSSCLWPGRGSEEERWWIMIAAVCAEDWFKFRVLEQFHFMCGVIYITKPPVSEFEF